MDKSNNEIKSPMSNKTKLRLIEIFMVIVTLIFLYPFVIMLFASLKTSKEALVSPASFPTSFQWTNYVEAYEIMKFNQVVFNSLFVTIVSVAGIIFFAGLAGFVIGKSKHKKFYNIFYIIFLCGFMIPFYTTLVPLVQLMSELNLNNSLIGLSIYHWGRNMPMAVFLYVGFVRSVPNEIIESGRIDGANVWQLYWKVTFPVLKPITTSLIILDALAIWNEFLMPRLMLSSTSLRTIPLTQFYFQGEHGSKYELAFAAYIISMLPILILYIFMQKNIIKGISAGAVKG